MSFGKSEQKSKTRTTSPGQLENYFNKLDQLTGGRLGTFATGGTQPVAYQSLTPDQLRSVGGAGATRLNTLKQSKTQADNQVAADPTLSLFQRERARQLNTQDFNNQADAIAKETEAALTGLAQQENENKLNTALRNQTLTRDDLNLLAQIFYGGKATTGQSSGSGVRAGIG